MKLHPVNQRFTELVELKAEGNFTKFSKMLGFSTGQTVRSYCLGEQFPSGEMLFKALALFPDISSEWLLRGQGKMIIPSPKLPDDYVSKVDELMEFKDEIIAILKSEKDKQSWLKNR